MERLTTNKPVGEMGMYELAHNCCYIVEDGSVRYRDFETDIDIRAFARDLMVAYENWKSVEQYGLDADNEMIDDDIFDESMLENLIYDPNESTGLIALFYRNLWAMAGLRERLKKYEDAEEQGLLLRLPCKVGTELFAVLDKCRAMVVNEEDCDDELSCLKCPYKKQFVVTPVSATEEVLTDEYFKKIPTYVWGKTLFATKEEAEQALKQMGE